MGFFKYIITLKNEPILFSRDLLHNEISTKVISAGFAVITFDEINKVFIVKCFGECKILKLESDPIMDKIIIEAFLNKYNINKFNSTD